MTSAPPDTDRDTPTWACYVESEVCVYRTMLRIGSETFLLAHGFNTGLYARLVADATGSPEETEAFLARCTEETREAVREGLAHCHRERDRMVEALVKLGVDVSKRQDR